MSDCVIFRESEPERGDELLEQIGLSREAAKHIGIYARRAFNNTSPMEPISAPGVNAWNKGTEALRNTLVPREGWKVGRNLGIESTVNHEKKLQLIYQNVRRACTFPDPQPLSPRGSVSRRMINDGTSDMFGSAPVDDLRPKELSYTVWLVCVCHLNDNLSVEVSRPKRFDGAWYDGFHERIFITDSPLEELLAQTGPTMLEPVESNGPDIYDVDVTPKSFPA